MIAIHTASIRCICGPVSVMCVDEINAFMVCVHDRQEASRALLLEVSDAVSPSAALRERPHFPALLKRCTLSL